MNSPQKPAPAVFFGHGSPMNALDSNRYTKAWRAIGTAARAPRAILCISAHWYIAGTAVTAMAWPPTIHDFGGFPQALFDMRYPAPGDPLLAARVRDLLAPLPVALDQEWGLDHGAWSVLVHAFPEAGIPVLQLSIDYRQPPQFHYDLGRRLGVLRDEGIMIAGSGDVVHNLRAMRQQRGGFDWAARFNDHVRDCLARRDHAPLIDYPGAGADARQSVPTPEHYLPLLYVLGAQRDGDVLAIATDGLEMGSISMLSCVVDAG